MATGITRSPPNPNERAKGGRRWTHRRWSGSTRSSSGHGQAGLSAGYHLAKRGLPFVILDADARIGDHWRDRWDSLKLYSPAKYDSLPGMPFPGKAWGWPTGREMGDYLEAYSRRFELPVRSGVRVDRVEPIGGGFMVSTSDGGRLASRQVVVATGPFRSRFVPEIAGPARPGDPTAAFARIPRAEPAPGRTRARRRAVALRR
jgi:cation diffusion facilitator CzcD-associated flavoprotein CzcO